MLALDVRVRAFNQVTYRQEIKGQIGIRKSYRPFHVLKIAYNVEYLSVVSAINKNYKLNLKPDKSNSKKTISNKRIKGLLRRLGT